MATSVRPIWTSTRRTTLTVSMACLRDRLPTLAWRRFMPRRSLRTHHFSTSWRATMGRMPSPRISRSTIATYRCTRCSGIGISARSTAAPRRRRTPTGQIRALTSGIILVSITTELRMASRTRPYEQFGPFILFKKLETDALSDLWRAGRIDGEKLALSLATTVELRYAGSRLSHGALIPQFVWISDDGEIRVAGQHLGKGMVASLKDAKVAAEIARYFSPECQSSGDAAKASDVYSMGAVFFLLTTGNEPPDAVAGSAFAQTIR